MKLKLIDKKIETGDVKSFVFSAQGGSASDGEPTDSFTWQAGQFMVYSLPHKNPDIRGIQRFFTISSAPFEKNIMLTTHIYKENRSTFKNALDNLKTGDFIEAKGPDGDFIVDDPNKHFVFITGGIGITPFRSIITQLNYEHKPLNIELLYANKTEEFVFKDELENLSSTHSTFNIRYVISPQHIDQKYIEKTVSDIPNKIFYVSGPEPMVEAFDKMLKEMKIKEENIKTDYFPGYETI